MINLDYDIFESSPMEKLLDILQNAPKSTIERAMQRLFIEHIAMLELLEKQEISEDKIKEYIFNNENSLLEQVPNMCIDLGAKVLGQEG
ncbi:DUF2018 family protein [Campylobacter canadensis]|uniref:DUF2018 family protein n=1 Tax=Campylobacter canadensis TaxID=449520 RepID=A0ABS7WTU6_9BACT|nr:DUF2018 family protein [Campylobacter canadensis]MBZ7987742.1 DUF2018 family protein [Campylobacter canadensis]MBZ7994149.1 DUF2018 family protein [Campylobacter canadensis]MBZ7997379.1 DUF2018 family protein [Campylobacter canadensis]MBZ7999057.1 DUF2018 family protein [Campylobacter canadensis]MBZ7999481.1 DUF2018 family protein [Campylobacter canadensis]